MSSSFSIAALFATPRRTLLLALALRVGLVLYGAVQDAVSPVKYTDIDYFVFTAAAAHVAQGRLALCPRHVPLHAAARVGARADGARRARFGFAFGKALFAAADLVAGWLVYLVLHRYYDGSCNGSSGRGMASERALRFASLWLLNPMVAQISTRGSSEGLLAVMVVALLWAVLARHVRLAGVLLGLAVHWKIYPVVYAVSIIWWLDDDHRGRQQGSEGQDNGTTKKENEKEADRMKTSGAEQILYFLNPDRATFAVYSFVTFLALNYAMYRLCVLCFNDPYSLFQTSGRASHSRASCPRSADHVPGSPSYGMPFLEHSYLHHLTRLDHRHNFSPYNVLLYLSSAHVATPSSAPGQTLKLEALAFVPQLVLCAVLIPLVLAKRDLAATMLAQTFAFVTSTRCAQARYVDGKLDN